MTHFLFDLLQGPLRWSDHPAAPWEGEGARELEPSQSPTLSFPGRQHEEGGTLTLKSVKQAQGLNSCLTKNIWGRLSRLLLAGELQLRCRPEQRCRSFLSGRHRRGEPERGELVAHPGAGVAADEKVLVAKSSSHENHLELDPVI